MKSKPGPSAAEADFSSISTSIIVGDWTHTNNHSLHIDHWRTPTRLFASHHVQSPDLCANLPTRFGSSPANEGPLSGGGNLHGNSIHLLRPRDDTLAEQFLFHSFREHARRT